MKLGNIPATIGLTKSNLMEAGKLGLGAAAFPFAYDLIRSQGLMKISPASFAQGTPVELGTRALSGVILGALVNRTLKQPALGDGMAASAVGSVARDLLARWMNPAARATQAAVTSAEQSTGQGQYSESAPLQGGIAGLAGFSGAAVAIEQGRLAGASVAIEQPGFATAMG